MSYHHADRWPEAVSNRREEPLRLISRLVGPRRYRVGEPWRPGVSRWEPDSSYNLDRDGHSITLIEPSPSRRLERAVASNPAELALVVVEPLLVLLCRFEPDAEWFCLPYAWPLRQAGRAVQVVPPARLPGEGGALLWVSLVDAATGLITAQRGTVMSREFTTALHQAIRAQIRAAFEPDHYVAAIRALFEEEVAAADLLGRATCRTVMD